MCLVRRGVGAVLAGWGENRTVPFAGFDCGGAIVGQWLQNELLMGKLTI